MTEKMNKKIEQGRQYRSMVLEALEDDAQEYVVEGYATTFDSPYTLYGNDKCRVDEIVSRNAFDECDMKDVIFQYDHEGRVFARSSNETLTLECDEHGLKVRAYLGGTSMGRQLYEEIKGGYTTKMSFGFIVNGEKEDKTMDGQCSVVTRTITSISKLFDVSAVSLPANDMTAISARNYTRGVLDKLESERIQRAKELKKLKLKLKLMGGKNQ